MSLLDHVREQAGRTGRAGAPVAPTAATAPAANTPAASTVRPTAAPTAPAAPPSIQASVRSAGDVPDAPGGHGALTRDPALAELKFRIHEELIRDLDPDQVAGETGYGSPVRRAVEQAAEERIAQADATVGRQDRLRLASEIADEVLGYGPLEPLLRDPSVTEIMVNARDAVYFERRGTIALSGYTFRDDAHVLHIIDKILRPIGRRLDESSPMVDARLPDGSRVNAVIPPLAVHGPSVTIRKFSRDLLAADDLIRLGSLTRPVVDFLAACVRARLNIIVSGGTGTGKTTMLNLLSGFIPPRERLVTIENPAELQIKIANWVSLETRPANIEGKGQIGQRELVVNALRMRPDRVIVGECRAAEAFDMLQAMNTGHDGSLTTVHANSPRDALARIENMVLMGVDLPIQAIREQVASAVNLVIQITRMQDGSRKVTHISEIVGMQGPVISMHDLFAFQGRGVDADGRVLGQLLPTGLRPHFVDRLEQFGERLPVEMFIPHSGAGHDGAVGG
jgi:pilus assembly protein CpaF